MKIIIITFLLSTIVTVGSGRAEETKLFIIPEPQREIIVAALNQGIIAKRNGELRYSLNARASFSEPFSLEDTFGEKHINSLRQEAKKYDNAFQEAVEDFINKNKQGISFTFSAVDFPYIKVIPDPEKSNHFRVRLLPNSKVNADFSNMSDNSEYYYGGLITISRPGIDKDKTVSIIFIYTYQGPTSADAGLYIFHKKDGKWILQNEKFGPSWVS